jgi:ubiquinone/menaquinone biosynthesis C-methylase UbiE
MNHSFPAISINDRVLHYPCGDGALCREIAAAAVMGVVVGLDPDDDNIRAARAAARDLDNVMFVCSLPGEIPWNGGFFSHVIVDNHDLPLSEVYRVLAEDGRMISHAEYSPDELTGAGFSNVETIGKTTTAEKCASTRPGG